MSLEALPATDVVGSVASQLVQSICVDARTKEGLQVMKKLVEKADVVIQVLFCTHTTVAVFN